MSTNPNGPTPHLDNDYVELNSGWEFKQTDYTNWLPATVPGEVHMDLLDNEIIEEPFYRLNEREQQWIGQVDWEYRTNFQIPKELADCKHLELVFEGLDTYADIYINGIRLGTTDNMFRTWMFDVAGYISEGDNVLHIVFNNVFKVNLPKWEEAPFRRLAPPTNDQSDVQLSLYSRKAGFHYGWDWGPRLITAGVWRPAYLRGWNDARLDHLHIVQKQVDEDKAELELNYEITSDSRQPLNLVLDIGEERYIEQSVQLDEGHQHVTFNLTLPEPELWWTNGLGKQPMYHFKGVLLKGTKVLDKKQHSVGLRSLRIVRDKGKIGRSFYVELNGYPVFMKGANYIPQDNFQRRVTPARHQHIIESAARANMNMLRVWGGGIYEDDYFYELCDRHGILVWQDMMFACGMFPADDDYLATVAQEVKDNVRRLRNHPSIALYCGNNENEMIWHLAWKNQFSKEIQDRYEDELHQLFYETIPQAIQEVDSHRYYHPTSPDVGFDGRPYENGNLHYWGVWHGKEPFNSYNRYIARFLTEYGFQSYPEYSTIEKFSDPEDRYLQSKVMHSHQRCTADNRRDEEYGNRLITHYMDQHYRRPKDFDMFTYVSRLLQAYGVETAIKAHRRNRANNYCMGTLYWQIDDCWPVASWSSIDYYGRWKALHYRARHLYKPVILSTVAEQGRLCIYVISDLLLTLNDAQLHLELLDFEGNRKWSSEQSIQIAPNTSEVHLSKLKDELIENLDPSRHLLSAEIVHEDRRLFRDLYYFAEPKDLDLPKPNIHLQTEKTDAGFNITVSTQNLARDIYLSLAGDTGKGTFSDNYFDLLPNEEVTIAYKPEDGSHPTKTAFDSALQIINLTDSY